MTTWLNTSIRMQFRVIDGLTVRFAQSQDRGEFIIRADDAFGLEHGRRPVRSAESHERREHVKHGGAVRQ